MLPFELLFVRSASKRAGYSWEAQALAEVHQSVYMVHERRQDGSVKVP